MEKIPKINQIFRSLPGDYSGYGQSGASVTKRQLKDFNARSVSPERDIDSNNATLRQRARSLYMASPIAASAIKTQRTNIIGCGLQLKSRINKDVLGMDNAQAEEWQKNTEHEFAMWAESKKSSDALGINDFYGIQQLALMSWLVSGDVFVLIKNGESTWKEPYSLRLQLIEADRVATPTAGYYPIAGGMTSGRNPDNSNLIYDGIEVDDDGRVVAYHIRSDYPYDLDWQPTEWIRVPAYGEYTGEPNILHLMVSERPDQYRGVTALAQIIEPLLQTRRYTESELTAALIESFFTAFVTTEVPQDNPFNVAANSDWDGELDPDEYVMGPGQVNVMKPGENITFANPSRPANGFGAFVNALATQMGAALEIPSDLLLKQFNSSYSASRAALLEFWKTVQMYREWMTADFCRPVYELWLSEAVARGRIAAPGYFDDPAIRLAWLGSDWIGPSQGTLDPTKEIQALEMAINLGLTTHADAAIQYNGSDFQRNMETICKENQQLADANKPLAQLDAVAKKGAEGLEKDAADAEKKGAEADATEEKSTDTETALPDDQLSG